MKKLGFVTKLLNECVSLKDYKRLESNYESRQDVIDIKVKQLRELGEAYDSLKQESINKDKAIISLKEDLEKLDSLLNKLNESDEKITLLASERDNANTEVKTLKSKILGLDSQVQSSKQLEKQLKEKLATLELDLLTATTFKDDANSKVGRMQVEISQLKEKLNIEAARKEIKSTRGNSALKKDEVLRVISLREANRDIISIAKEMDLTIDSVENILNGNSYSRWTAKVLNKPAEERIEETTDNAVEEAVEDIIYTEITIGTYNTVSDIDVSNGTYLVGTKNDFLKMLNDISEAYGYLPVCASQPEKRKNENIEDWLNRATIVDKTNIKFKLDIKDIEVSQFEQTNSEIPYPILKATVKIDSRLLEDINIYDYKFSLRSMSVLEAPLMARVTRIICWDLITVSQIEKNKELLAERLAEDAKAKEEVIADETKEAVSDIEEEALAEPKTNKADSKIKKKKRSRK